MKNLSYPEKLKILSDLQKREEELSNNLKSVNEQIDAMRSNIVESMKSDGVKRVEGSGKQVVMSSRKYFLVGNEVQAQNSLLSNGVSKDSFFMPSRTKMSSIAKELIEKGKEVEGFIVEERESISIKDLKEKEDK